MQSNANTELLPLNHFCTRIPGHTPGSRCHTTTMVRHILKGVRSPAGQTVRLQAVLFGKRWLTTEIWFAEFLAALTTTPTGSPEPKSPSMRRRASENADAELAARGC